MIENQGSYRFPVVDFNFESIRFKVSANEYEQIRNQKIVQIKILLGKKTLGEISSPKQVRVISQGDEFHIVYKFTSKKNLQLAVDRRRVHRLTLRRSPTLTCFFEDPMNSGESIFLNILNVSDQGVMVSTSLSNKQILPGLHIDRLNFLFAFGICALHTATVRYVRRQDGEIILGLSFGREENVKLKALLAEFALTLHENKADDLKTRIKLLAGAGLKIKSIKNVLRIKEVNDAEEYQQALALRLLGYQGAGKVSQEANIEDMRDEFDDRSRILIATIDGCAIGTCRMIECLDENSSLPLERYFGGRVEFGADRTKSCEVSRLTIHPALQHSDAVVALFSRLLDACMKNGIETVLCVGTPTVGKLYQRMGARTLLKGHPHPQLKNETLELYLISPEGLLKSEGVMALSWEMIAKPVALHLAELGVLEKYRPPVAFETRKKIELGLLRLKKSKKNR